jgi:hypothetical protein
MAQLIDCNVLEHTLYAEGTEMVCKTDEAVVLKRDKTIFMKSNNTLYHWLHPNLSKKSLNTMLSAASDALPMYISEVTTRIAISVLFYLVVFTVRQQSSFIRIIQ